MTHVLRAAGLRPRKKLGQNFLVDPNISRKLIRAIAPQPGEAFLEIGAGVGALTVPLAETGAEVFAVEIDPRLTPLLKEVVGRFEDVHVIEGDILSLDISKLAAKAGVSRLQVLGNLPYNITTQVILYLIENRKYIGRTLITIQREYAGRLLAGPGSRSYGSISVLTRFYATIEKVATIPRTCFFPAPEVTSTAIRLQFREKPLVQVKNEGVFEEVVRAAFSHRRKTLLNSVAERLKLDKPRIEALLKTAGVDSGKRAEELTLEELAGIADVFYSADILNLGENVSKNLRNKMRDLKLRRLD